MTAVDTREQPVSRAVVCGPGMDWANDQCHRFNNFDALRFWLAAMVILSHSYPLLGIPDAEEPLMRFTGGQMTFGTFAVCQFFTLSGFLITQSWVRGGGLVDFLRKRILRIYPGLIVAVLLGALVMAPLVASSAARVLGNVEPLKLVWGCIKLSGYSPPGAFESNPYPNAVNGSLWTIPYEFRCYLLVAGLGLLGVFRRAWLVVALFAVATGASMVYAMKPGLYDGGKMVVRAFGELDLLAMLSSAFLAGSVFYLYRQRIARSRLLAIACAVVLTASLFLPPLMKLALPTVGTYLFFYIAFTPDLRVASWGKHGDFSYGIYLYGFPVQQTLVALLGASLVPMTLFPLAFLGTLVLAVASWYLVERPCLRLARGPRPRVEVARVRSALPTVGKESVA